MCSSAWFAATDDHSVLRMTEKVLSEPALIPITVTGNNEPNGPWLLITVWSINPGTVLESGHGTYASWLVLIKLPFLSHPKQDNSKLNIPIRLI
jgi:hypothetical protein